MDHYDVNCIEDITYDHTGPLSGAGGVLAAPREEFDDIRDYLKLDLYLPVSTKDRKGNRQSRGGRHGRHMPHSEDPSSDALSAADALCPPDSLPPVVLFVHGGGWKRGGRRAWIYYLSDAYTNFPEALYAYWCELHGNVGHALAARGLPCAVMSYPPLQMAFPVCLLAILNAAVVTMAFCSGVLLPPLALLYTVQGTTPASSVILTLISASQGLTWAAICYFRCRYRKFSWIWNIVVPLALAWTFLDPRVSPAASCLLSFLLVQGTIAWLQMSRRARHTLEDQLSAVTSALCYLRTRGARTREWDPDRLYAMGHSAGAHLVATVALRNTCNGLNITPLKGVICISGVYDISFLRTMWLSRHLYYEPFGVSLESPPFSKSPLEWLRHHHRYKDVNSKTDTQDNKKYENKDLVPCRLPHFLIVTTGWEPDPIASQSAEFASALTTLGVSVRTVHDKKAHHLSVISNFGRYRTKVDELRTFEDVCVDFINVGTNDCVTKYPVEKICNNFKEMAIQVKQVSQTGHVTFRSITPRVDNPSAATKGAEVNEEIRCIAEESGCQYICNQDNFLCRNGDINGQLLSIDGLRLSKLGTEKLSNNLKINSTACCRIGRSQRPGLDPQRQAAPAAPAAPGGKYQPRRQAPQRVSSQRARNPAAASQRPWSVDAQRVCTSGGKAPVRQQKSQPYKT